MARTISGAIRSLLASDHFVPHLKIEVEDADGAFKNMNALLGDDRVDGMTWGTNNDSPVVTGTAFLRRDIAGESLAPLMGSSAANRNSLDAYAPLLQASRRFRAWFDVTVAGASPTYPWKIFEGKIDKVRWNADPVEVSIRDEGAWLLMRHIETEIKYAQDPAGEAIQSVLQAISNDWPTKQGVYTIVTPVDPLWDVGGFTQPLLPLMEALREKALAIGHDFRFMWASDTATELRFFAPDRDKTVADWSFGPTEQFEVSNLEISDEDIRNRIEVEFVNSAGQIQSVIVNDTVSQNDLGFGIRYMKITKDQNSSVRTLAQATALANFALSDLARPGADHEVRTSIMPFVELHDLIAHQPTEFHYDSEQKFAVVGWSHSIKNGQNAESLFTTRGKPAAARKRWISKGDTGELPGVPEIAFVNTPVEVFDETGMQIGWTISGAVDSECNSLMIQLTEGLEIYSVSPLGYQYFDEFGVAQEYRASMVDQKEFVIELRQAAGDSGTITLIPRAEHSTSGGGGDAGPPYEQVLQRPPFTTMEVEKVGDPKRRSMTLSATPPDSQIRYRMSIPPDLDVFTSFFEPTMPPSGKITEPSIALDQGDVVVEFQSVSAKGVAEEIKRRVIDLDDDPEWQLDPLTESPGNYINVSISLADDDGRSWSCWARNGASPKNASGEPLDIYRKRKGDFNVLAFKFYAENGTWQIVVRVYDADGNWTEQTDTIVIDGIAGTIGALEDMQIALQNHDGNDYHELRWTHNQAVEDDPFTLTIRERMDGGTAIERVTGRDPKLDHLNASAPELEGGWHIKKLIAADANAEGAEFHVFVYEIDLLDATDAVVATYKATISGYYIGNGGPDDPGGGGSGGYVKAPTPIVDGLGISTSSARATWTDDDPLAPISIGWATLLPGAVDWQIAGGALLDPGTTTHIITNQQTGAKVRCVIQYGPLSENPGEFSDLSNEYTIPGSGGGSTAPTLTPPKPDIDNISSFRAELLFAGASSLYKVNARFESSPDGVTWSYAGSVTVNAGVTIATKPIPDGYFARGQIAYVNAGGAGPYSEMSDEIQILI